MIIGFTDGSKEPQQQTMTTTVNIVNKELTLYKEPLHCPLTETAKALYTNTHTVTNRQACYWHYKQ